jgi:uncharacterized protein YdeI (YjbR/CyaY-like superfamily)
MEPIFFPTPADLRAWLAANHDKAQELWVGYYKTKTGRPSVTWPGSVDQALCFGWIDGVRKSIDGDSYMIRFTPRKSDSTWSAINIKKVEELTAQGLMHPAGIAAFENRKEAKTGIYSYEQRENAVLDEAQEQQFRAHPSAWEFFESRPRSYRRVAIWWVVSAKKPETRAKRMATLIELSAAGELIPQFIPRRSTGKRSNPDPKK